MASVSSSSMGSTGAALLRQDEALLKAKRKRLKAFGVAVDELRRAADTAAQLATELIESGDLSRTDLGRVFKLTRAEKSTLTSGRKESAAQTPDEGANAAYEQPHQHD